MAIDFKAYDVATLTKDNHLTLGLPSYWFPETSQDIKTYFISGHLDISIEDFYMYYRDNIIDRAVKKHKFIVGDARGTDTMAQELLLAFCCAENVTVYHIGDKPRNNLGNFKTVGGFKTDENRDKAMTKNSDADIAWVRSEEASKKLYKHKYVEGRISGTMKNLMRRQLMVK